MDEARAEIIERIQKLFAHHQGATEAEAVTAVALARKLLDKHRISMAEVENYSPENGNWREEAVDVGEGLDPHDEADWIAPILVSFFGVRVFTEIVGVPEPHRRTLIFGDKETVAVATRIFVYLKHTFYHLWLEFKFQNEMSDRSKRSYYAGLSRGLATRLLSERQADERQRRWERPGGAGGELAISEAKIDQAAAEHYPDAAGHVNVHQDGNLGALLAGMERGQEINIAQPVEDQSNE